MHRPINMKHTKKGGIIGALSGVGAGALVGGLIGIIGGPIGVVIGVGIGAAITGTAVGATVGFVYDLGEYTNGIINFNHNISNLKQTNNVIRENIENTSKLKEQVGEMNTQIPKVTEKVGAIAKVMSSDVEALRKEIATLEGNEEKTKAMNEELKAALEVKNKELAVCLEANKKFEIIIAELEKQKACSKKVEEDLKKLYQESSEFYSRLTTSSEWQFISRCNRFMDRTKAILGLPQEGDMSSDQVKDRLQAHLAEVDKALQEEFGAEAKNCFKRANSIFASLDKELKIKADEYNAVYKVSHSQVDDLQLKLGRLEAEGMAMVKQMKELYQHQKQNTSNYYSPDWLFSSKKNQVLEHLNACVEAVDVNSCKVS